MSACCLELELTTGSCCLHEVHRLLCEQSPCVAASSGLTFWASVSWSLLLRGDLQAAQETGCYRAQTHLSYSYLDLFQLYFGKTMGEFAVESSRELNRRYQILSGSDCQHPCLSVTRSRLTNS